MNEHGEEEDRVGEEETLDSDNPHRYLFGADPLPPQIPNPLPVHIPTPQTVQEPIVPLSKPEEPKTNSSKLSSPPPAPQTSHLPPSKIGQYDDRFKTTVDYHQVLTTLVKLKDQREQALLDLRRMETERKKAQEDPQKFVSSLLAKREVIPRRQIPPTIPKVDFATYEKLPLRQGAGKVVSPPKQKSAPSGPSPHSKRAKTTSNTTTHIKQDPLAGSNTSKSGNSNFDVSDSTASSSHFPSYQNGSNSTNHEMRSPIAMEGVMEGETSKHLDHASEHLSHASMHHGGATSSDAIHHGERIVHSSEDESESRMSGIEPLSNPHASLMSHERPSHEGEYHTKDETKPGSSHMAVGGNQSSAHSSHPTSQTASTSQSSHKSVPHHTTWSLEEQRKLEQLLIEYPDEPVAAYRWEKIARALNRTPKQVVSRIHRYFERLARAGLPIPGRLPDSSSSLKSSSSAKSSSSRDYGAGATSGTGTGSNSHSMTSSSRSASSRSSTAPSHTSSSHSGSRHLHYSLMEAPSIKMDSAIPSVDPSSLLTEEEKAAFAGLENTTEYRELLSLKRLKAIQQLSHEHYVSSSGDSSNTSNTTNANPNYTHTLSNTPSMDQGALSSAPGSFSSAHPAYAQASSTHTSTPYLNTGSGAKEDGHRETSKFSSQCSSCHTSIQGTLYRCLQCNQPKVTLCASCHHKNWTGGAHLPSHTFDSESSFQFVDSDYALSDDMAYLDPNYLPV